MTADRSKDELAPATLAVHGGERREGQPHGAVVSPVYHSSTYSFSSFDEMRRYARGELGEAYFYSRYGNPTVAEVERKLAALEGAEDCVVTSSGSAATFCAFATLCKSGDEVIVCDSVYGGTTKIVTGLFKQFGVSSRFVSIEEIERLPEIAGPTARVFWFETPANPINRIVDLSQAAAAARRAGLVSIVDNTFATPILQRPLAHGIDAVMHSATKYLGGHSDLTAGAIAGSHEFIERVRHTAVAIGATLDPAAAYLLARGIKSAEVRVRAASHNALKLAQVLQDHPKIAKVYYPGLASDPGHQIAKKQMSDFGAVVAIEIVGGEREAEILLDSFQLIRQAPSLGGVESLASYPLYSSHSGYSDEQLRAAGVSASIVRLAIGIEAADDLIADVLQALDRI